jgi:hypothetical protein
MMTPFGAIRGCEFDIFFNNLRASKNNQNNFQNPKMKKNELPDDAIMTE